MLTARQLLNAIMLATVAHDEQAKEPKNRVRKWDERTPYAIHPIWCAMTLLHEHTLPEELRVEGALALLWHDVPEDTQATLPSEAPERTLFFVDAMTNHVPFATLEDETAAIFGKPIEVQLLKLYDVVGNLLDGVYPSTDEKRAAKRDRAWRLVHALLPVYGNLNIICIARALLSR